MAIQVLGCFETPAEALAAVESYALAGHRESSIVIFTNEENAKMLEGYTKIKIKTDRPVPEKELNLTDKMRDRYKPYGDIELDSIEKLMDFGLSKKEAEGSMLELRSGHVVIFVDERVRMGQHDERYNETELEM